MKGYVRKGIHAALLLTLFIVLIAIKSPASASRTPDSGLESASANSSSGFSKRVTLAGLNQQGDPPGVDPELIRRLKQNARGKVSISTQKSTQFASFVRVSKDGDLQPGNRSNIPQGKANGFFAAYGGLFGVKNANAELALLSASTDSQGATHMSYQQVYKGVPVFAAILRAHVDSNNNLTAMNGVFIPDVALNTSPAFSADQAAERALAEVLANPPQNEVTGTSLDLSAADLTTLAPTLYVYRDGLIQNIPGLNYLVYEVEVTNGSSVDEMVYINAHNGKIVNRISLVEDALFRRLYEISTDNQIWQEGDPFPGSLNQDQQNIVNYSGDAYYHFFNAFGRDSYNGAGAEMRSVNNDPRISCPNANWNGLTTNYCNGVTGDDVVAHEWGHAYTEYTHNLIYQWQSGALNESYSDIWGETVDILNGSGTDTPAPMRSDNACSNFTTPVPVLTINSPASIAGDYAAGAASFGPPLSNPGITGDVVLADDGTGTTTDACEALVNGGDIAGHIALVDRGSCNFTVKVKNAQNAGATSVIVADNQPGPAAGMGGSDDTITIPSLRVTLDTGNLIKSELAGGVNATLHVAGGAAEDSYRWLMGEDATAFGGAIRDMWSPTCLADPGKVTDAQYFCAASDGGGVHTNSGVPNHGYSLLVDGGTYNGHTVNAIGMVKAAHLYWLAQSVYQTPTTNFADHADALEAACQDLIGVPLEGLSTTSTPASPSGESITTADCTAVHEMTEAIELRTDPTAQCNFQPLLQPDAPALCSDTSGSATTAYLEDFEAGLSSWTLTNKGVFSGWPGLNWEQASTLPGGRSGAAAFGADPDAGNCDANGGDISGVQHMDSGDIVIPAVSGTAPRLAFDHYVATESGWDGGNLKISINGGPFTVVPASAFTFNAYNTTLQTAAAGNTNPLAGQPGFSGTDGGSHFGTWGQSQVDLTLLGVAPGDTIRLRYDMGIDGCTGNDGWYVDDVNTYTCEITPPDCSAAFANPGSLWPPNHMFNPISIEGVTDPNDSPVSITIKSIWQDEAVLAPDSGHTSPDGRGIGTDTAEVRAERVESGNGRVYYITFAARNDSGGICTGTVEVGVPTTRDGGAVGDGANYDSTQP
ncbi:MAG: M4 family metallopeptidase [Anaerolineales bacterium]